MSITVCEKCGMKVIANSDGRCPSCGSTLIISASLQQEIVNHVATKCVVERSESEPSTPTHFDLFWILLSLRGRLSLGMMWISTLISILISLAPFYLGAAFSIDSSILGTLYLFSLAFMFWSSIAIAAKRFHDLGWSGWLVLLGLFPMFGQLFLFFTIGCLKGRRGSNLYGIAPRRIWSAGMVDEIL